MKVLMKSGITLLIFASMSTMVANSQHCIGFHEKKCMIEEPFEYDAQSKSALFSPGHSSEMSLVAYRGKDYRISFCLDKNLGEEVEFQVMDSKTREVLYDNREDDMSQEFKFSASSTQRIILKVNINGDEEEHTKGSRKIALSKMWCLGVLVERMNTPKLGF